MKGKKLKYAVLVPDGMADYPLDELNGRTPLEVARTPNMDLLAAKAKIGRASFVPEGMTPGSDVANLAIFGYDPRKYYSGRAPFEAENLGIAIKEDEIAFRCNFVSVENDMLIDYSAGHITTKEARVLIKALNKKLSGDDAKFYPGISYRHILVLKSLPGLLELKCSPPHDIMGEKIKSHLPKGKNSERIIDLMNESIAVLTEHDINLVRIDLKENPANMIWLWGQGRRANMPSFQEKYGLKGSVISAVDLIKGIGRTIGLNALEVPGATGYYDTDYEQKAAYALKALEKEDFVFVHVEAPDEAGHNADVRAKISAIENFDRCIVGAFVKNFPHPDNLRMLILPDHPTPISLRTHSSDPVCFMLYGAKISANEIDMYNEKAAEKSSFNFENGFELMDLFVKSEQI